MDLLEAAVDSVLERLLWRARRFQVPATVARAASRLDPRGVARLIGIQRQLFRAAPAAGRLARLSGAEPITASEGHRALGALAAADLAALVADLCELYGVDPPPQRWRPRLEESGPSGSEALPAGPGGLPRPRRPGSPAVERLLTRLFGLPAFRPGQRDAVVRLLEGRDTILVLPTGGGKSIVYQLAALLLPGTCLVVQPTLSLIEDQRRRWARAGAGAALAFTSEPRSAARRRRDLAALAAGRAHVCFAAPERLLTERFQTAFRRLAAGPGVSFVAFDEAHCIAEWGHNFRPSYLSAAEACRRLLARADARAPVLAATATLSEDALPELRRALGGLPRDAVVAPVGLSAVRSNLELRVRRCRRGGKPEALAEALEEGRRLGSGIVFCPRVDGPDGARAVAGACRRQGLDVALYHGRPPADVPEGEWQRRRESAARSFLSGRVPLLAATKAFGIGIDKPDIRFTIHYGLPGGQEAFEQESGRAGRDGAPTPCWILASADLDRARRWLSGGASCAELRRRIERLPAARQDDATRALSLHLAAFPGVDVELDSALQVLARLGDVRSPGARLLRLPEQHQPLVEKALVRWGWLGVISEYTTRWSERAFLVRLPGYGGEAPEQAMDALLERLYATVERRRRASLLAVVRRCAEASPRPSALARWVSRVGSFFLP